MRRFVVSLASAAMASVLLVSPAVATPPADVTIDVELSTVTWEGDFEATGSAVDDGIMCATGESWSVGDRPWPTGPRAPDGFFTVGVYKLFFCDGDAVESDAFVARLVARCYPGEGTIFQWAVIDGWGRFETLRGAGNGTGSYAPGLILDHYVGRIHFN